MSARASAAWTGVRAAKITIILFLGSLYTYCLKYLQIDLSMISERIQPSTFSLVSVESAGKG